jgi:hypothetical protein
VGVQSFSWRWYYSTAITYVFITSHSAAAAFAVQPTVSIDRTACMAGTQNTYTSLGVGQGMWGENLWLSEKRVSENSSSAFELGSKPEHEQPFLLAARFWSVKITRLEKGKVNTGEKSHVLLDVGSEMWDLPPALPLTSLYDLCAQASRLSGPQFPLLQSEEVGRGGSWTSL